ncbi:MAG: NTP transferase domain-containing protein, partial [Proteobacteria bacterium]|nr:NTP transferase domain-containing protein [Pseudomonadota bacterium]
GASSRMGKTKQLLPFRGQTLLECVVDNALAASHPSRKTAAPAPSSRSMPNAFSRCPYPIPPSTLISTRKRITASSCFWNNSSINNPHCT